MPLRLQAQPQVTLHNMSIAHSPEPVAAHARAAKYKRKGRAAERQDRHLARHASKSSTMRGTLDTEPCLRIRHPRKSSAVDSTAHSNGVSMPWAAVYLGAYLRAPSRAHILVGVAPARSAGHCVTFVREESPSIRSRPCWQVWIDSNPRSSTRSSASLKSLTDGFPLVC